MNNIVEYKNGNYHVRFNLSDGTKERYAPDLNEEDDFIPEFAESYDIKITNKCTGSMCEYCYEGCGPDGKHGDILNPKFLDTLHPYTEIAINGNDLSHPDLIYFLEIMKQKNVIVNMTVNQIHFEKHENFIRNLIENKLIYGLGISLRQATPEFINKVKKYPNAIIHVINGIFSEEDFNVLKDSGLKLLILGYKFLRRGIDYYYKNDEQMEINQRWLYQNIENLFDKFEVVSFDNIAIEQLDLKRLMSDDEWNLFFMGKDGCFSFYIDLVAGKFAKNSISLDRYPLMDSVDDMFKVILVEEMTI